VSILEAIWTLESDPDLTDDQRADSIAQLKASEWSLLQVPFTVGAITVTEVRSAGRVVELWGTGDALDWPLRLVNAPIAVRDAQGSDVDAWGQTWRIDVSAILTEILGRF
jgi:hypothetical protein